MSKPLAADEVIPLARPLIGKREIKLVKRVLRSGRLSLGPMLARFEADLAAFCGGQEAVATSSGTTALHLAVRQLGWEEGAAVLTTPLSFVATANALLYERVEPVFCDIDPVTLNLDPAAAAAAVGERTVGVLPVHIFGAAAAMPTFEALAASGSLSILEDGCQALGARDEQGQVIGSRGNLTSFAFYANKQLTTGEGGALVCADPATAAHLRSARNQGRAPDMSRLDFDRLGFNYRLSDLQAALGVAQLERADEILRARVELAALYRQALSSKLDPAPLGAAAADQLAYLPDLPGEAERSWFVYLVRLPRGVDRRAVIDRLAADLIETKDYLPCIHLFEFYRERFGYQSGQFPIAEEFAAHSLSLPFWVGMGEVEVERVCTALAAALAAAAPRAARRIETAG